MNCLEFRQKLLSEPRSRDTELQRHAENCPTCADFAVGLGSFEQQLRDSLETRVPEGLQSRILLRQRLESQQRQRRSWMALAAAVLLALTVTLSIEFSPQQIPLEQVVLNHVNDELHHLQDNYELDMASLNRVLKKHGTQINSLAGQRVNYAGACKIRRHQGAHMVLGSEKGPVTVLLMPGEFIDQQIQVTGSRFQGFIIPYQNGSIAFLGEDNDELARISEEFSAQLRINAL